MQDYMYLTPPCARAFAADAAHVIERLARQKVDRLEIFMHTGANGLVNVRPPALQEMICDDPEPGRPQQPGIRLHHGAKLRQCHVLVLSNLVRIRINRHVCLDEQDVIHLQAWGPSAQQE